MSVIDNPRGRAFRLSRGPGEASQPFVRPGRTAVFAISGGLISETPGGKAPRLWDLSPGHFKWTTSPERLTLRNEGKEPIQLVEVEVR